MSLFRVNRIMQLAAFFAVLCFAGDIVADSIADARGEHCVSQTSDSDSHHEKTPCSHCSCAVHIGAIIVSASAVNVTGGLQASDFLSASDQSAPVGLPKAIDHPPQLA
jgi:hypothetical protein